MVVHATLCHIIKNGKLLLQRKSKGLFGEGKWNGIGGKLKPNEIPEEGVKREVFEETHLKIKNLFCHGLLNFYFGNKNELDWMVYVFSTNDLEGKETSNEEGILEWFSIENIPYKEMWQDDAHWLPLLLKGKKFRGKFYFDEEGKELVDFNLKEIL